MKQKQVKPMQIESTQPLWSLLDDEQSAQLVGGGGVISGFTSGFYGDGVGTSPLLSKLKI